MLNLKGAFATFFAGRAPLAEAAAPQVSEPGSGCGQHRAASAPTTSSWLAGIVKPDTNLDLEQVFHADAEGSTSDLDELECETGAEPSPIAADLGLST